MKGILRLILGINSHVFVFYLFFVCFYFFCFYFIFADFVFGICHTFDIFKGIFDIVIPSFLPDPVCCNFMMWQNVNLEIRCLKREIYFG